MTFNHSAICPWSPAKIEKYLIFERYNTNNLGLSCAKLRAYFDLYKLYIFFYTTFVFASSVYLFEGCLSFWGCAYFMCHFQFCPWLMLYIQLKVSLIAKLSFSQLQLQVGSWDSFSLNWSSHPATHPPGHPWKYIFKPF